VTWRGAFTGALLLIALEAVVRTSESANRVGGFLETGGDLVRRVMSPAVPLIPDTRVMGDLQFQSLDGNGPLPGG
jgi:hypothetical protein